MRKINAFRWARQAPSESPAATLARSGWMRGVGGASPYLAFWRGGWDRATVDAALAAEEIVELPSARGCTYFLPREHAPLGLALGYASSQVPVKQAMKYLGVTETELGDLREAVIGALSGAELDPKQIREAVGDKVRSLGDEGKKRGLSSTLTLALGPLQSEGRITRVSADGRLDRQNYRYKLWNVAPFEGDPLPELAKLYFGWAGPARLEHFQWFTAASKSACKTAMAGLNLVEVEPSFLALPEDADAFHSFKPSADIQPVLVGSLENHLLMRRDIGDLLSSEMEGIAQRTERGPASLISATQDLGHHAIIDRGEIVGLWEYDPEVGKAVAASFRGSVDTTNVSRFIREELGDFRSFSLDGPKSRREAINHIRALHA